jgi:hypothetical protein
LICDEIENFDDKLLHAAQQSDLLKKNVHATMQLTIPGREQKTATLSSSCSLWIAFPHTTRSKKKRSGACAKPMQIAAHIHSQNTDNKTKVLVQRKERAVRFILSSTCRENIMCMMIVS